MITKAKTCGDRIEPSGDWIVSVAAIIIIGVFIWLMATGRIGHKPRVYNVRVVEPNKLATPDKVHELIIRWQQREPHLTEEKRVMQKACIAELREIFQE